MRVLVTWGSKAGGTEEIARIIGEVLQEEGYEVHLQDAAQVRDPGVFDAAVIGGSVYLNRWNKDAHHFVDRHLNALRLIPVWMFSSGPLDDSAERGELPAPPEVTVLMERLGARGHVTFGGRLAPDAHGMMASQMAKTHSGDWRNPEHIRAWARELAHALPNARPGEAVDLPAASPARWLTHGLAGWVMSAMVLLVLLRVVSTGLALALHAAAAALIFTGVSVHYFRGHGARDPLPTAAAFTAIVAVLHVAIVGGLVLRDWTPFTRFSGNALPLVLIFLTTWVTGLTISTMPWPEVPMTNAAAGGKSPPRQR